MWKSSRFINESEKNYYKKREELINSTESSIIAESPFLFTTRSHINEIYTRIKIFEMIKDLPGHILECGVFTGNNLMLTAHLLNNLTPFLVEKKIIGFDTFNGFDDSFLNKEKDNIEKNKINCSMFKNSDIDLLKKSIELYDSSRPQNVNHLEKIELIKGDACLTIPEYVKQNPELIISLLYLDFDLYEPTKIALKFLYNRVIKGGVIVLDEFSYNKYPGETIAVLEELGANYRFKKIPGVPFKSYFIKE